VSDQTSEIPTVPEVKTSEYKSKVSKEQFSRLFARKVDYALFFIVVEVIFLVLDIDPSEWKFWFGELSLIFLWIFFEPIFLCVWGKTPGKALFGIIVKKREGKITYLDGLKRSIYVYGAGNAIGIPIANVFAWAFAAGRVYSKGRTLWDEEYDFIVERKSMSLVRYTVAILVLVAIFFPWDKI
jgi:hypothetical protein